MKKSKKAASEKIAPVTKTSLNTVVNEAMYRYGIYTLEHRAIPSIQDGLKPVQRRILWAMYKDIGVKDSGYKVKCAKVTGTVIGSYHPHGNIAVYDALVRMVTQISTPLIFGEGNFGSSNDPPAAERYTTCRLNKFSYNVYFDPYYIKAIDKIPNYDGSTYEPSVLPALLPMSLIVNQSGIAVAISTSIPSFSPESVKKATQLMFKKKAVPSSKWLANNLEWVSPFGGKVISGIEEKTQVIETGRGKIIWECDYSYDGKNTVTITGIPPEWSIDTKIQSIANEKYVNECTEQTDKSGLKIVVKFKRADEDTQEDNFIKFKNKYLQITQTISMNQIFRSVVKDGDFADVKSDLRVVSVKDILKNWGKWRTRLENRALNIEIKEIQKELKSLNLLVKTIDNLDIIFELLKKKGIDKTEELSKKLSITIEESKYIWSIAVGRLDKLNMDKVKSDIKLRKQRLKEIDNKKGDLSESVLNQLNSMKI